GHERGAWPPPATAHDPGEHVVRSEVLERDREREEDPLRARERRQESDRPRGPRPVSPRKPERRERQREEEAFGVGRQQEETDRKERGQQDREIPHGACARFSLGDPVEQPHGPYEAHARDQKLRHDDLAAERHGNDPREEGIERKEGGRPIARGVALLCDVLIPESVPALPRREEFAPWLAARDHEVLPVPMY